MPDKSVRRPGQATLGWIKFGLTASHAIATFGGLIPTFGTGLAAAASAVDGLLEKKEKDQEDSMK